MYAPTHNGRTLRRIYALRSRVSNSYKVSEAKDALQNVRRYRVESHQRGFIDIHVRIGYRFTAVVIALTDFGLWISVGAVENLYARF